MVRLPKKAFFARAMNAAGNELDVHGLTTNYAQTQKPVLDTSFRVPTCNLHTKVAELQVQHFGCFRVNLGDFEC